MSASSTADEQRGGIAAWLRSPAAKQVAIVTVASLVLRLFTLSQLRDADPLFQQPVLDDAIYIEAAQRFVDGAPARSWFLAPLYPVLLGIVAKLGGVTSVGLGLAAGLSGVLGGLTSGLLALAARTLGGARAGWITGALHAGAAAFVFQDLVPGQEAVLSLLYAGAVLAAMRWYATRSWGSAIAYGALVGLAALGRGTAVLLLPAALPLVLSAAPEAVPAALRERRRAVLAMAVAAAATLVVLVPAMVRNQSVSGDLTPFTWSFGPNLYAANSPEGRALGTYHSGDLGSSPDDMAHNARRIAERHESRALSPGEISAWWRDRTLEELGGPADTLSHLGTKVLLLFSDHPFGSSHALAAEARFATWLRIAPGGEWWILALGVGGWWLVRRRHPIADTIALAAVLTAGVLLVLYPTNRYRLALVAVSTVLTGAGVARISEAEPARRVVAAGLVVVAGVLAHIPGWAGMFPHALVHNRANVGRMLFENGRPRDAVEVLLEADRDEPGSVVVLGPLAAALDAVGDPHGAARAATAHNRIMETLPAGRVRMVLDLAERGRTDRSALAAAERLGEELFPTLLNDDLRARLWANLALVAALRGDPDEARARMVRARSFAPDLPHHDDVLSRMPGGDEPR